jgi:hypothetical protein
LEYKRCCSFAEISSFSLNFPFSASLIDGVLKLPAIRFATRFGSFVGAGSGFLAGVNF